METDYPDVCIKMACAETVETNKDENIYVSDKEALKDMSLEVANTLASYQLEMMFERVELISDLASTLCKGISEMVSNEKGSRDE